MEKIKKSKKGQMELLGIAIVIVIILVGVMFFFLFAITGENTSIAPSVIRTQIGANTINTLLKTTTLCKKLTISELITDCVDGPNLECSGKNSCEYVKSQISYILENTLTNWGIDYQFDILKQTNTAGNEFTPIGEMDIGSACTSQEHFEQLLPTQISYAKASLNLCN
ncbi:MAG: hypothetical protein WC471_00280 [Candidatus Woesearchaeota archaeon]